MANTPMVILWQAANGSTILSQRQAAGRVEPLPVTHPPRQATVVIPDDPVRLDTFCPTSCPERVPPDLPQSPNPNDVSPVLSFRIEKNETSQPLIWAFGVTAPDPDPNAAIEQHLDAGSFTLNLSKLLEISSVSATGASSMPSSTTASQSSPAPTASFVPDNPLSRNNSLLVAHAVLCAAGFLILLPLGALVARWARVCTPKWFTAHWFINIVLGIPLICIGWALGPLGVAQQGLEHVVTAHQVSKRVVELLLDRPRAELSCFFTQPNARLLQITGVILFALYIIQVAIGTLVHLRRPKDGHIHPLRNVVHVVLGLAIFGLSIYEVRLVFSYA